jgi:tetratricopeptide (TPR) repeat protein
MAKVLDLFSVLDGLGENSLGKPIQLSPDPALKAARDAIRHGAGIDEALIAVEKQIDIARPMFRGFIFEVVDTTQGDSSLHKLRHLLCDLHLSAARLTMLNRQWDAARAHLIRAVACQSGNPYPELTFPELYVETGEYQSAITSLERGIQGKGHVSLSLFELANDLAIRGATEYARMCFDRVVENDQAGTFTEIVRIRLADLDADEFQMPSGLQINELSHSGWKAMQNGEVQRALDAYYRVLSLRPREGRVWFLVGYILCVGQEPEGFRDRINAAIRPKDMSISGERYRELRQAEEALSLACRFDPELVEAKVQLASCYLLLDQPTFVQRCADEVFQQRHSQAWAYSLLSQVLIGIGDTERAARAVNDALEIDPGDPLALRTLKSLLELDEALREAVELDLQRRNEDE